MRLGIISDLHEDVVALRDAFKILEHANCTSIVCLGDITGFKVTAYNHLDTRNAHECIAMVRANCSAVVIGNHDLFNIKKLPPTGFDFPKNWYDLDYFERKNIAKDAIFLYEDVLLPALLSKEDRSYLESLPFQTVVEFDSLKILLSHFAFPDLIGVRSYFPKTVQEFKPHLEFIKEHGCTMGISGHMHYEGVSVCDETSLKRNGFTLCQLQNTLQWVYGPCVARGRFNNGVMIFDTATMEIEAVPMAKVVWINETERLNSLMQTFMG